MPSGRSESESRGAASDGEVCGCDVHNSVVDIFLLLNGEAMAEPEIQFFSSVKQCVEAKEFCILICLLVATYKRHMLKSFRIVVGGVAD